MRDFFRKHYGDTGYNEVELASKLRAVNEAHGVDRPNAKWKPAVFQPDPRGGWMVVIETR